MAVTQNSYIGNGSTTNYSFTFPYLKQSEIKASLDATVTTAFNIPNATTIQFNTAPGSGVKIKIYRETDSDSLAATFYAGSAIKSEDLNDNFTQNLYSTQEVTERYLSNLGGTMVGDLQLGEDVVIKFEGATDNAHETTLTVVDPTADRTITLPNVTGTVVTTGDTGTVATAMIAGDAVTGAKIADDQINSEHYVDGSIDTAHIADLQVTTDKLASNAVTTIKILDANVTTAKIADSNVTTAKIAADAITGAKIADDQINSEHYVAASIDTEHIADANVTTAKIADDAVTAAKLANTSVSAGSYTAADITVDAQGRVTSAASGAIATSEITDSAVTTAKIADANVTTAKITDANVTTAKIADANVTTAKITDANVTTAKIADSNVTTAKIADSNVTTAKIADGNVTTVKLAADAIDATKIADNAVTTDHIQDAELTTLAGMQSGTASILADSTALTSTTTELNQLDGKTLGETTLTTNSNTAIPTSKAVNDRILTVTNALGGFVAIANETSFPATHPDPSDGAGTVVSVSDAGGVVVNGSGVASVTNGAGSGNTVTINGFPSSLYSKTLGAGIGLQVQTTTTLHTYTYHKILAKEADVEQLSGDINDFNERYRVAGSAPGSNNDAGDLYFDTAANKMKVYNGTTSTWDDVASVGNFFINTISSSSGTGGGSATFNGSAYRFTLSNPPTMAQQLIVSVNGVIQKPDAGSSQPSEGFAISGNDIIFSAAPASGSDYFIVTQGSSVSIGTPSDNTVSTAKIQNQAVTTAKITDANVTNAKIADDTIAEGKLDVHNAPATGKYLKYTSNGMEWSDGASEGTDVKSTGESGTTKFLRVDGDGTCSWQVPPTISFANDANNRIVTGTGSGLNGEANLTFDGTDLVANGSGDVAIRWANSGTNKWSIFNNSSGGGHQLQIFDNNGSGVAAAFNTNASVDLYYDNSKKLETTSSGINVTGAINVNGAALSSAPEITANASGAVTAGDRMQINTNGTTSPISQTNTALSSPTGTSETQVQDENTFYRARQMAWDPDNKKVFIVTITHEDNNNANESKMHLLCGTVSTSGVFSFGAEFVHSAQTYTDPAAFYAGNGRFGVSYRDGGNSGRPGATLFSIDANNAITQTASVELNGQNGMSGANYAAYNPTDDKVFFVFGHDTDLFCKSYTCSAGSFQNGSSKVDFCDDYTAIRMYEQGSGKPIVHDPDTNRMIVFYVTGTSFTNMNTWRARVVKLDGTSITVGAAQTIATSGSGSNNHLNWSLSVDYDTSADKLGFCYAKTDGYIYARTGTVTGGSTNTISTGTEVTVWNGGESEKFILSATGHSIFGVFYRGSSGNLRNVGLTISGTSLSVGTYTVVNNSGDCKPTTARQGDNGQILVMYERNNDVFVLTGKVSTATTNADGYVGIANNTASDGNSVTIRTFGSTNSNQSGLTTGSLYYIKKDGTLSTTADDPAVTAGIALSATKLLIK